MISKDSKLPISALIVCFDEGHLLGKCIQSIQFCEQIVVVNSVPRIIRLKWPKSVEQKYGMRKTSHC